MNLDDAEAIADPLNCPDVAAVAPVFARNAQVIYRNQNANASIEGTTPDYALVRNATVAEGRFIDAQDLAASSRVAILGARIAIDLFDVESPLAGTIRIDRTPFRVIGVLAEIGGGGPAGSSDDDAVIVPISTAQTRLFGSIMARRGGRAVSVIHASAMDAELVEPAIEQITELLRQRHRIQYQEDDFTVTSQQDILGVFNQVTDILTIFLGSIAAISLLVGGIGIMNIMLVSVTERTREIGIRKAVGARRRDITIQFMIEAIVLSIIGGIIGIGFGAIAAAVVNTTDVLTTRISFQAVALAVSFSLAVGLFFGIYPATRAGSLNPIDALRYE